MTTVTVADSTASHTGTGISEGSTNGGFSGLSACLDSQRAAFLQNGAPALAERKSGLKRLRKSILRHRAKIEQTLVADFGHRAPHETAIMELMPLVGGIDYLLRNLRRFMRPKPRHVPIHLQPARAFVAYQPLGVIGIVAPWNYPLSLALMPLATALAAGNRAMIKPSELTPATSELLVTMLGEIFPQEQVAVFTGDASVGAAFSSLPFDHIFFTGSTRVGSAVMKAASENLVPLTLELGGKSPAIVAPDHPLEQAAAWIAYGKLANEGQTCISPDYVLVPEGKADQFLRACDQAVRKYYPAGPLGDQYTSLINDRHHARLRNLIEDARTRGAQVMEIGVKPEDASDRPHTIAPTVVLGVTEDMKIMQEEIFGPVLPVVTYRDIDAAIAYVNARPRPLALYYFGGNNADRRKVLASTTSGNVTVNATLMHYAQDDLPFGGIGPSGMGAYHGIEGFRSMSHAKGTLIQGKWNLSRLLRPPFGKIADLVLKIMLR